jgi:hypothetical protein
MKILVVEDEMPVALMMVFLLSRARVQSGRGVQCCKGLAVGSRREL